MNLYTFVLLTGLTSALSRSTKELKMELEEDMTNLASETILPHSYHFKAPKKTPLEEAADFVEDAAYDAVREAEEIYSDVEEDVDELISGPPNPKDAWFNNEPSV